jgi:uncharacterized membrane protein YecN with MAPEG domain
MTILPITLTAAGAAGLINIWLAMRVGRVRTSQKILMGDGGNESMIAAMRAHANFVEYTPFVLILLGLIEYNIGSALWLWIVSAVYLLGRIAHPFGMDGVRPARTIGTATTLLILLGLGIYAAALPFTGGAAKAPTAIEAPAKG